MRVLFLLISIFINCQAIGQEFRWEIRMYVLQDFIKENSIKEIRIGKDEDSILTSKNTQRLFQFDKKGRLSKMLFQYSEGAPKRKVEYTYEKKSQIYQTKKVFSTDSTGTFVNRYYGNTHVNKFSNLITEIVCRQPDDTLRVNKIKLNQFGQITFRESEIRKTNYTMFYQDFFTYNSEGQFETVTFKIKNFNTGDSLKGIWKCLFDYDQTSQIRKFSKTSFYNLADTITKVEFNILNKNLNSMVKYQQYSKISDKDTTHYFKKEEFNFAFDNRNFLKYVSKERILTGKSYLSFKYEFYNKKESIAIDPNKFISTYFLPIDLIYHDY